MAIKRSILHLLIFTGCCLSSFSQNWNFRFSGRVEVRNWKLSNRAMKSGTVAGNASIELKNNTGGISETTSDNEGHFNLDIPANGNFTLTVKVPGQNPKNYLVSTKSSQDNHDANFRPVITISGMISEKHRKDMNYVGFDAPTVTTGHSNLVPGVAIHDGEYLLIQKFCTANKLGDLALEKKNYALAKTFYTMAMDMMGTEPYPKEQLKKAGEGLKIEKDLAKKQSRSKQSKLKSAIAKQKINSPPKSSENKIITEPGKSGRKIRKAL